MNTVESFWEKVDKSGDCWLWTGSISKKSGYAQFSIKGRVVYVHRFAYEQEHGPIPEGLDIDHTCRVRHCVRPKHLEAVTLAENNRRAAAKRERKLECVHGHAFTKENTYINPRGHQECVTCRQEAVKRHSARKRL